MAICQLQMRRGIAEARMYFELQDFDRAKTFAEKVAIHEKMKRALKLNT